MAKIPDLESAVDVRNYIAEQKKKGIKFSKAEIKAAKHKANKNKKSKVK